MTAAPGTREDIEISILIVSWRTPIDAVECVRSTLHAISARRAEIIVVDNDSRDGTVEMLAEHFSAVPNVVLVSNETNRGFAAGNNQAYAMSSGAIVAVVNPDARPTAEAFERLIALLGSDPSVGLASCCLVGADDRAQTLHRRLPTMWIVFFVFTRPGAWVDHRILGCRTRDSYKLMTRPRVGIADVGQIGAAFVLMRREVIEDHLGGVLFDERLPILVNDVDLSRRISEAGFRRTVDWDVAIRHGGAASLRQLDGSTLQAWRWDGLQEYYAIHGSQISVLGLRVARCLAAYGDRSKSHARTDRTDSSGRHVISVHDTLVTVVIPCFNYGRYVADAIESALNQTYENVEIIVIDDGSTDNSASTIDRYADRVHVIHQENRGLSAVRNHGASVANGHFVVYLDADDCLKPRFIERCVDALHRHPTAAFAYTQVMLQYEHGEGKSTALQPYSLDRLLDGNEISACALIRRELILNFPYDEDNRVGWEDWDFWLLLAEHGWGGVLVDDVLMTYRRHGSNMTGQIRGLEKRQLQYRVLRRHARLAGFRRLSRLLWSIFRTHVSLFRHGQLGRLGSMTSPRSRSNGRGVPMDHGN